MPVFSMLAGIIPLSLRNEGHLIPFAPLVCKWGGGATAPLALPPMSKICRRLVFPVKCIAMNNEIHNQE